MTSSGTGRSSRDLVQARADTVHELGRGTLRATLAHQLTEPSPQFALLRAGEAVVEVGAEFARLRRIELTVEEAFDALSEILTVRMQQG
jgi:hypothetical protein